MIFCCIFEVFPDRINTSVFTVIFFMVSPAGDPRTYLNRFTGLHHLLCFFRISGQPVIFRSIIIFISGVSPFGRDQALWLQLPDQGIGLGDTEFFCRTMHRDRITIQPDTGNRTVIGQQFRKLGMHEINIPVQIMFFPVMIIRLGFIIFRTRITTPLIIVRRIGITPVPAMRIIEAKPQSFFCTLFCQLSDKIPFGRRLHTVKVSGCRIEKTKAVMMTRGDIYIFHLCLQCQIGDKIRIEMFRRKFVFQFCIVCHMDLFIKLNPFPSSRQGVKAIM